jgi:hypothetical protein
LPTRPAAKKSSHCSAATASFASLAAANRFVPSANGASLLLPLARFAAAGCISPSSPTRAKERERKRERAHVGEMGIIRIYFLM